MATGIGPSKGALWTALEDHHYHNDFYSCRSFFLFHRKILVALLYKHAVHILLFQLHPIVMDGHIRLNSVANPS